MARTLFAFLMVCLMLHANAQTSIHQSITNMEKKTIKQDAGRKQLGDFAPKFAELNDDVLFGQVWNRQDELSLRDRSLITVVALVSMGMTDSSLTYHLQNAKANGITRQKISEVLTHIAFYVGWPKAWAAFRQAKEVWAADSDTTADAKAQFQREMIFPIGEPNTAYAKYFIGQSYLAPVSTEQIPIHNVTFEPGCRNNCTSTTPRTVEVSSSSVWLAAAGIRSGASPHASCCQATW